MTDHAANQGGGDWQHVQHEMDEARHALEHLSVDLFCEATENAAHYVIEAGKGLADTTECPGAAPVGGVAAGGS